MSSARLVRTEDRDPIDLDVMTQSDEDVATELDRLRGARAADIRRVISE